MKTKTATGQMPRGAVLSSLAVLGVLSSTPSAHAAPVFCDGFEDGDHSGWSSTEVPGQGGSGSTGVEFHNSSQMAIVYHQGKGKHSLSRDFSYSVENILSFDMHAVAKIGSGLHSRSGVVMSFLNFLNQSLGSISLINATNPSALGPDSVAIDSAQHDYTAEMGDFAASAGLDASDPITKMSLDFFSTANYSSGGGVFPNKRSSATVWFDNVIISEVSGTGYAGVWWEPNEAGQGIHLGQNGNSLFGAWYVYDENGADMWVTFVGELSGTRMEADLVRHTGPALGDPWSSAPVTNTVVGHATVNFASETSATFDYTLNGVEGSLDLEPFAPGATDTYTGIWWEPAEAGQGVYIGQDGSSMFGAWYVFDETGGDMWTTFAGTLSSSTLFANLVRYTGPPLGAPWNLSQIDGTSVGNVTITFTSPISAMFDYTINGVEGSLDLTPCGLIQ